MRTAEPREGTRHAQPSVQGEERAWQNLVQRYAGLIATVIHEHQLAGADAEDVSRYVWLHLAELLPYLRELDLPGWLVATTRRECRRYVRADRRALSVDPAAMSDICATDSDIDVALLLAERRQVLLDALAELPDRDRKLLVLLAGESPPSYAEISEILDMPIESVEPHLARAIDMLRRTRAVQSYLRAGESGQSISESCPRRPGGQ
ncbi:MAG TPA: sigma-70 family RNA polymerase sigma factor [Micromonosporaceae bacterium]|nr:sigma-70 family RNA polymerase sigma factor [Micromonosporaceae bacterium]